MFKRIIASLLLNDKKLVKGEKFKNHKVVGVPKTYCKSLGSQTVDEIFMCDLNSYKNIYLEPDFDSLSEVSSSTMTPLTFGGGLNSLDRIKKSFYFGADKVYLSSIIYKDISIIEKSAKIFGSQSIVGGINVVEKNNRFSILEDSKLDFVDREGTAQGFNLSMCKKIVKTSNLPLIFEGGIGSLDQIKSAFKAGVGAVGLGRMISFEDNNIFKIKQYLSNNDFKIR